MAERRAPLVSRVGAGAALVLVLTACGRGPSGDEQIGSEPPPPPAASGTPGDGAPDAVQGTLEADVAATDVGIEVRWTWTNDGDEEVYAASRTAGPTGSLSPSSLSVVGLDDGDGGLQVGQRVFDQPADDPGGYAAPFYLGVTVVPPGGSVRGVATVSGSPEEAKPFPGYYAPGETSVSTEPTSATFCLGVLTPSDDPAQVRRVDGDLVATHGDTSAQTLFCADPIDLP